MWAWSLDMEEDPEFAEGFGMQSTYLLYATHHVLGPSLHPLFSSLSHLINDFNSNLSAATTAVVLSRVHVIPSARYTQDRYPAALARHLSSTIPPPSATFGTMNVLAGSVETIRGKGPEDFQLATNSKAAEVGKSTFLGTMTMDMRKWNWPEYLTFGKGNSSSERPTLSESEIKKEEEPISPVHLQVPSQVEVEVNANDLQDAIASDSIPLTLQGRHPSPNEETKDLSPDDVDGLHDEPNGSVSIRDFTDVNSTHDQDSPSMKSTLAHQREETLPLTPSPSPEFTWTRLHLAPWDKPTETQQVSIHYLIVRSIHIWDVMVFLWVFSEIRLHACTTARSGRRKFGYRSRICRGQCAETV